MCCLCRDISIHTCIDGEVHHVEYIYMLTGICQWMSWLWIEKLKTRQIAIIYTMEVKLSSSFHFVARDCQRYFNRPSRPVWQIPLQALSDQILIRYAWFSLIIFIWWVLCKTDLRISCLSETLTKINICYQTKILRVLLKIRHCYRCMKDRLK